MSKDRIKHRVFICPYCNLGGAMGKGQIKAHLKNHKDKKDTKIRKGYGYKLK